VVTKISDGRGLVPPAMLNTSPVIIVIAVNNKGISQCLNCPLVGLQYIMQ